MSPSLLDWMRRNRSTFDGKYKVVVSLGHIFDYLQGVEKLGDALFDDAPSTKSACLSAYIIADSMHHLKCVLNSSTVNQILDHPDLSIFWTWVNECHLPFCDFMNVLQFRDPFLHYCERFDTNLRAASNSNTWFRNSRFASLVTVSHSLCWLETSMYCISLSFLELLLRFFWKLAT
jgi:hypothetical protein